MSDQASADAAAEAIANAARDNADDDARISAIEDRLNTLESVIEGMKNAPAITSAAYPDDVVARFANYPEDAPQLFAWIRTVLEKFHSSEKPAPSITLTYPIDPVSGFRVDPASGIRYDATTGTRIADPIPTSPIPPLFDPVTGERLP